MRSLPSISVVLPAFNEAQNLAPTVNDAIETLDCLNIDYEIVIVDDGSKDGTSEVCRALAARFNRIRIVRHPRNRGYGAALRSGFEATRCDLVFVTDADRQFHFDQVPEFMTLLENIDMVIGYREDRQDPWYRRFNSRIGHWFVRRVLGVPVRDANCAYKLVRRDLLRELSLEAEGAMISTELLANGIRAGWNFREVPVRHYPRTRGKPTGTQPIVILRTIVEFIQFWRRHYLPGSNSPALVPQIPTTTR